MTTRRPVADLGGYLGAITSPDTIDPAILPASGATPLVVLTGTTFSVADNTQVLIKRITVAGTGQIQISGTGQLIGV